jgi:o-succinylbenzoate synthase
MHVVDIPMRVRFRRLDRRIALLLHGTAGWGEFSPFPEYDDRIASRWLAAAREAADLGWPQPRRDHIPVNTTVPAVGPQQAHAMVVASGCSTAKVKVAEPGQSLADDEARVEAVRDALGPAGKLRVDANAAWTVDEAVAALTVLSRYDLEYAEQPVLSLEEMAALRRRVEVRLAADESIRTAADPLRVAGLEAADVVVLKVQPIGGVRACLRVAAACGLPVVVSSAIETSVGIAAGLALAAALPDLPYACGRHRSSPSAAACRSGRSSPTRNCWHAGLPTTS